MEHLGSFTFSLDIPEYYRPLSLRLFSVMDDIGASEEVRKVWIKSCVTKEILKSMLWQPEMSEYRFGSSADGTTTLGMQSDFDNVYVLNNLPVVIDRSQHPVGNSLLVIQDDTTPAGYCELQLVQDGVSQYGESPAAEPYPDVRCKNLLHFSADANDRLVCSFKPKESVTRGIDQRHGPALTLNASSTYPNTDLVYALECKDLPVCTHEWLTRERDFNWPTKSILQTCQAYGSLFVPVGHPLSESQEQKLQWRVSLSQQEKLLVKQFNNVQYKCYILLKMINKEIINYQVSESLSSYHIKTCMFYMSENMSGEFWRPENLLSCVNACLIKLLQWVCGGYCPNYFIPEENMFDRRVHGTVRLQLKHVLQQLVIVDCKFLISVRCDKLGERLIQSFQSLCITPVVDYQRGHDISIALKLESCLNDVNVCLEAEKSINHKLLRTCTINIEIFLSQLLKFVSALQRTTTISRHTKEETLIAKSLLLPYLELSLMTNSVVLAINQGKDVEETRLLLSSIKWKELSLSLDSFSSRLKQASLLYMYGDYNRSLYVLSTQTDLRRLTVCRCYSEKDKQCIPDTASLLEATRGTSAVSPEYLLRKVIIPCVYFLPIERNVTPIALCYEMERMRGPRPGSDDDLCELDKFRGAWAFVDGNFLLYFLLYLNHNKLNMKEHVTADVDGMVKLIDRSEELNLSHRETCLNLLGCVFTDQGNTDRAEQCFRKSLRIKPYCNAAFRGMVDLHYKGFYHGNQKQLTHS